MSGDPTEELVKRRMSAATSGVRPRLRFDKVALRLLRTVKDGVSAEVPDGKTVLFTIAAPIRLASKTAAELQMRIRACLRSRSIGQDTREEVQGNEIRVRVVESPKGAPKVLGFVYSPQPDAAKALLDMAQALLG